MIFYHCADIHLGKTFSGSRAEAERFEDYFRAFSEIVQRAVEEQVNAVLISGDLFHQAQVSPHTLARTVAALEPLRRAGIPVIAVEGNHDWLHRHENISWLEALSEMGYLHLLRPEVDEEGRYTFTPWDKETKRGGRVEIGGVRFYGLGYIGALAGRHVPRIVEAVSEAATEENVLLFHVGVRGLCWTDIGNMTPKEARPLAQVFKYVALGHGHKAYELKDDCGVPFAFNPGSPERVRFGEETHAVKGFNRVVWPMSRVGPSAGRPYVEHLATSPRPMLNETISLEGSKNLSEAEERLRAQLARIALPRDVRRPIMKVKLTGRVGFRPLEVSRERVVCAVGEIVDPLHLEYENVLLSAQEDAGSAGEFSRSLDEVEREVVKALFASQSAYRKEAARWADLAIRIKEILLGSDEETDPADLLDLIHRELHAPTNATSDAN